MSELSAKYKLSEDGEIISVNYSGNVPQEEDPAVLGKIAKSSEDRMLTYQQSISSSQVNVESFMSLMKKGNVDDSGNSILTPFLSSTNGETTTNGDFEVDLLSKSYTITPKYRLEFNNIFANDIYASEMEMLSGINNASLGDVATISQKLVSVFEFIVESIIEIVVAEGIYAANEAIAAISNNYEEGVEESFHHTFGEWGTIDVANLSKFLFRVCNYPTNKTRAIQDVDERIAAFILGFESFINTESLIDFGKIARNNKNNLLKREVHNTYGVFGLDDERTPISGIVVSSLQYLVESTATLTTSGMKQFYLLKRKFAHQSHWRAKELHAAKRDKDGNLLENSFDYYMTRLSLYRFKFIAERMHVGLKFIRYYQYNSSPSGSNIAENGHNRLGLSKSGFKDNTASINSDNIAIKYIWSNSDSGNDRSQSTRIRSLPQAFLMTQEFIDEQISYNSEKDLSNISDSVIQNFAIAKNKGTKRLPKELVKKIEDHLEQEYMPFYFHDLRTNEIISFHAFLDNISDSFSPEYNPHTGFGRVEEVKHYTKTTRSIDLSFTLAATSKEDHDLMWFQINKIVAMCYPQWSKGTNKENKEFGVIPFSQIPASSPMIRLRVGDVIKSNYSEKTYSRIEGFQYHNKIKSADEKFTDKKLTVEDILKEDITKGNELTKILSRVDKSSLVGKSSLAQKSYLIPGSYKAKEVNSSNLFTEILGLESSIIYLHLNEYKQIGDVKSSENTSKVTIKHKDKKYELIVDNFSIVDKFKNPNSITSISNPNNPNYNDDKYKLSNDSKDLLSKVNNPITRTFETAAGKGLAGFITNLGVDYNEQPWETAEKGAKAPMIVKLSISFSPIHDVSLGLDYSGMIRSPAYNVGKVNNYFFGDTNDNETINRKIDENGDGNQ